RRSEPFGQPDRRVVLLVDAVDDLIPAEGIEDPVDGRRGAFECVALAVRAAYQAPAHLAPGPAARFTARVPRAEPADPSARLLLDDREHRVAEQAPGSRDLGQRPPRTVSRRRPTDEAHGLGVLGHGGKAVEVVLNGWT